MANSCSFIPCNKQGEEYKGFGEYRSNLGYKVASEVFPQVLSPSFKNKYKSKLELDEQGVPTYKSAITVKHIQNVIGVSNLMASERKKHKPIDNTRENYRMLLQEAYNFNKSSELSDTLTAVVVQQGKKIVVDFREKSERSDKEFQDQYGSMILNEKLVGIFKDIGVTVEILESSEVVNGKVDFSKTSDIANGFKGLISISNNMGGDIHLTEEFCHLLIGMFADKPLVQRSIKVLEENEELLKEIFGDEYEANRRYYIDHPNRDSFGNIVPVNRSLAEEALGRILRDKLVNYNNEERSGALERLIDRLVKFIKRMFKGKDINRITEAVNEVDMNMGELAKNISNGAMEVTKEKVMNAERQAVFNHVNEKIDLVLQTLRNANEVERKRYKIASEDSKRVIKERITTLEDMIINKNQWEAIHKYAQWALADLEEAMKELDNPQGDVFVALRRVKTTLDSYGDFIREFHETLDENEQLAKDTLGEEVDLRALWKEINNVYESCTDTFKKKAFGAFSDFLEPIYEKAPLKDENGNVKPLKNVLLEEEFDISEFDRWVVSMGNSSSIILQLFDKAVKNAKDAINTKTETELRDIWAIRRRAKELGITSFNWLFEKDSNGHKTGYYVSPYNIGQFEKDKKEMQLRLIEKYGKHPIGDAYKNMVYEKKAWYEQHAVFDVTGKAIPNDTYKNSAYNNLTDAQKEVRKLIIEYKEKIERDIPKDRRNTLRAIQRRRSSGQRIIDNVKNPTETVESLKEVVKSTFTRTEDDDQLFGERTQGLTDFTGKEYLTVPVIYTSMLNNPDELSDDVIGDLMVYRYMANTYMGMSAIADPMEIGYTVITGMKDKFVKGKGGKIKEEVINALGRVSRKSVKTGTNTNFEKKLRDYLECQVYGKYLKDDDVLGPEVQKTISFMQKMTSTAYLGLNVLSGIANVATAVGMQNIEVAARQFFGPKELALADASYFKRISKYILELGSPVKQSELALFDELFNVKQDFNQKLRNNKLANVIRKFFGESWMFMLQAIGDHWIYNRTALAMARKKKVIVDGKEMSVWDAKQIITDRNGYKKMIINPKAKNLDGSDFSAKAFSREIAHVNHTLVGIYNDDDQNAANRVVVGRCLQQMRKWIVPQMMRRFQSKRKNMDTGLDEEGYYRAAWRFAKDIWKSGFKIAAEWKRLKENPEEFQNVCRALTEIVQTYSLWVIMRLIGSGVNDPDRGWGAQFLEWLLNREVHELGFLTPGPMMLTEGIKTIQSPAAILSSTKSVAQAMLTTMWPGNWFPDDDELIQSGRYEGHSYIYKRWAELPLPPFTQFRQIEKFMDGLDDATKFYARDYK